MAARHAIPLGSVVQAICETKKIRETVSRPPHPTLTVDDNQRQLNDEDYKQRVYSEFKFKFHE